MADEKVIQTRARYVQAWNETMIQIWRDQIRALNVIDTEALLNSLVALPIQADGRYTDITISEMFLLYGIYQDKGVGREKPKGNTGDIGPTTQSGEPRKLREVRPWYSSKYYISVLRLKEFMGESIGKQFKGLLRSAFKNPR